MPRRKSAIKAKPPEAKKAYKPKGYEFPTLILCPHLPEKHQGTKLAGRPDFDLSPPEDWPKWLRNMHTENASVEVTKEGKVYWWGGTVHDGIWMDGYFMGGRWRDGIWMGGEWLDGIWYKGEWRDGRFYDGTWWDGVFRNGLFSGLWRGGLWLGGEFEGFLHRSMFPPTIYDRRIP